MRPEARPIKFTNGHAQFYMKNKVATWNFQAGLQDTGPPGPSLVTPGITR